MWVILLILLFPLIVIADCMKMNNKSRGRKGGRRRKF